MRGSASSANGPGVLDRYAVDVHLDDLFGDQQVVNRSVDLAMVFAFALAVLADLALRQHASGGLGHGRDDAVAKFLPDVFDQISLLVLFEHVLRHARLDELGALLC